MNKNNTKLTIKLDSRRNKRHGGYTYLPTGKLPEHRKYTEKCLTAARENLIKGLGPNEENLTAAQIILIDRVVTKLGVIRRIKKHIGKKSVCLI